MLKTEVCMKVGNLHTKKEKKGYLGVGGVEKQ